MPVTPNDLKLYASLNRPADDVSVSGGGVDVNCILDITQMSANDQLRAVSDNAADTMNLIISGRSPGGEIITETLPLTGLTPVVFTLTFERFISAQLASAAAGNVTIERNAGPNDDVVILPAGKTDASVLFVDLTSEAAATTRFEKDFWQNEHATLSLINAAIELTADPSANIRIGVVAAKNDTTSIVNRKAVPGGVTFTDDGVSQSVPTGSLAAGESIGIWAEMSLGVSAAPLKTSFTTQIAGQST